jgi:hypothetical protein
VVQGLLQPLEQTGLAPPKVAREATTETMVAPKVVGKATMEIMVTDTVGPNTTEDIG